MARPRTFHENQVLSRAMRVFWRLGYNETGIRDLEEATGLTASSLYNAYGNKEAIFLRVLDHYVEGIVQRRIDTFLSEGDPITGIRRFFETTYQYIDDDHEPMACLLVNTAQQAQRHTPAVRERLVAGMGRVEEAFARALQRLPSPPASAGPLAAQLNLALQGLLITSRVDPDRTRLQTLTDAILAPLERGIF